MKISILLPAYKSDDLLLNVFSKSSLSEACEIICYDNGGNDKARKELPFKWIGDGTNVGLNVALNACAKNACGDYYYLPHTDMCLLPDWSKQLLTFANRMHPETFMFCSRSIESTQGHTSFHHIQNFGQEFNEFDHERLMKYHGDYKMRSKSILNGYRMPFFLSRELWQKMNGVDENYFSYASDDDLFMTAYNVGVRKFWMFHSSLVYHLQGKSNEQQNVDRDSRKPYNHFFDKWTAKGYIMSGDIDRDMQRLVPWYVKVQ